MVSWGFSPLSRDTLSELLVRSLSRECGGPMQCGEAGDTLLSVLIRRSRKIANSLPLKAFRARVGGSLALASQARRPMVVGAKAHPAVIGSEEPS
jgi:hypothetical protein